MDLFDLFDFNHVVDMKQVLSFYLSSLTDNPQLTKPEIQHLLVKNRDGTYPIPFYTLMLDETKSDIVFRLSMF
jgi:hypothetical protein